MYHKSTLFYCPTYAFEKESLEMSTVSICGKVLKKPLCLVKKCFV